MKTVWLLISPVVQLTNSAVTNRGAAKVKSFSLHSSAVYFGSSKRCSRNDSDMVPPKSSIGEISSKISSRPAVEGTSWRPDSRAAATRACQRSLPSSQSKLSVCRPRRSGTSSGSWILAKEMRRDAVRFATASADGAEGVREAAKRGPSLQFVCTLRMDPGGSRPPGLAALHVAHVRRVRARVIRDRGHRPAQSASILSRRAKVHPARQGLAVRATPPADDPFVVERHRDTSHPRCEIPAVSGRVFARRGAGHAEGPHPGGVR